jgi:phosphoadenosine phosphosulfate reductase
MDIEKEKRAIQYLRSFEPEEEPYYLCYSGGKDSDAIRILAQLAGVKHECKHNLTTVDAPETVRYVREMIGKENIRYPKESMWKLIVRKRMPPTRTARYCCETLKERGGEGRLKITGVRWDESRKRKENAGIVKVIGKEKTMQKKLNDDEVNFRSTPMGGVVLSTDNAKERRFVEYCYRTTNTTINPIVDWTNEDVWEFLHHYGCESNPLYQCGRNRVGCIGCPLAGGKQMKSDFARYPKYKAAYIRAFDRMLEKRKADGLKQDRKNWINGEHVMRWWVRDDPNQITIDDYLKMTGGI